MAPVPFHILSISLSAVTLGLSIVNFGAACIGINSTASLLTLLYHLIILFLIIWRRNSRAAESGSSPEDKFSKKHSKFSRLYNNAVNPNLLTYPSLAYSSPYEKFKFPKLDISNVRLPAASKRALENLPSFGPFHTLASFLTATATTLLTIIGFAVTLAVTLDGINNPPQVEFADDAPFPWDVKVQRTQCVFLGLMVLRGIAVVVLWIRGRWRIMRMREQQKEAVEFGLA